MTMTPPRNRRRGRGTAGSMRLTLACVAALFVGTACGSDAGTGNTNWRLECESDRQCSAETECLCGWCQPACEGRLDCSREDDAQCVADDPSLSPDAGKPNSPDAASPAGGAPARGGSDSGPSPGGSPDAGGAGTPSGGAGGDGGTGGSASAGTANGGASGGEAGGGGTGVVTPSPDPEPCSLAVGEWLPMAPEPPLDSLTRAVRWHDGALHYMGDGTTGSGANNAYEYGRFDPCSNAWERQTVPKNADTTLLVGWTDSAFAFRPFAATPVVSLQSLSFLAGSAMQFRVDTGELAGVTEPFQSGSVFMVPEDAAPESPPVMSSMMNGAHDGSRAIAWGLPLPTDEEPEPAPLGWVLDEGALQWREVNSAGAPSARRNPVVVPAGGRFVVWGGSHPENGNMVLNDGAFYDPNNDSWEAIPSEGAPGGTSLVQWIGDSLIVSPGGLGGIYRAEGGWLPLDFQDDFPAGNAHRLVLDDQRLLLVAGTELRLLDVANGTWLDVPEFAGAPEVTYQPDFFDVVWTGSTLLFWGSSVPQTCAPSPEIPVCDLVNPYLPAGEGVMVRLE